MFKSNLVGQLSRVSYVMNKKCVTIHHEILTIIQPSLSNTNEMFRRRSFNPISTGGGGFRPPAGFCLITRKGEKILSWILFDFCFNLVKRHFAKFQVIWNPLLEFTVLLLGVCPDFPIFSIHFCQKHKTVYLSFGKW